MEPGPDSRPPQTREMSGWKEGSPPLLPLPGNKHEVVSFLRSGALQDKGC